MSHWKSTAVALAVSASVGLGLAVPATAAETSAIRPGSRMVFAPYAATTRVSFVTASDGTQLEERRAFGRTSVQSGPGKGLSSVITVVNKTIEPNFGDGTSLRDRHVAIRLSDGSQIVCEGQAVTLQNAMVPATGSFERLPCFDGIGVFTGSDVSLESQLVDGGKWQHTLRFRHK